jgi:hypothetical protein
LKKQADAISMHMHPNRRITGWWRFLATPIGLFRITARQAKMPPARQAMTATCNARQVIRQRND